MAVVAHALTTLAKVKSYLGITDTDNDVLLEELIDNVTEFVEGQLMGRRIKKTSYVDELHDGGEEDIFLLNYPIIEPPTVTGDFRSGTIENPTFQAFQVNDFVVYNNGGFIHFFFRTPRGARNLRFTYDGGFTTIPDDLDLLAKQIVAKLFQRRNAQGIKKETVEGSSIEYQAETPSEDDLTKIQIKVIDRYIRHSVGENL